MKYAFVCLSVGAIWAAVILMGLPYAAGMIAIIWLGSAALEAIDCSLPLSELAIFDCVGSVIIALLGFPSLKR